MEEKLYTQAELDRAALEARIDEITQRLPFTREGEVYVLDERRLRKRETELKLLIGIAKSAHS